MVNLLDQQSLIFVNETNEIFHICTVKMLFFRHCIHALHVNTCVGKRIMTGKSFQIIMNVHLSLIFSFLFLSSAHHIAQSNCTGNQSILLQCFAPSSSVLSRCHTNIARWRWCGCGWQRCGRIRPACSHHFLASHHRYHTVVRQSLPPAEMIWYFGLFPFAGSCSSRLLRLNVDIRLLRNEQLHGLDERWSGSGCSG